MTQPTLINVFGANATQDATTITLTKADFAGTATVDGITYGGLTPLAVNNGEQILVAVLIKALQFLTINARLADFDHSVEIVNQGQDIVSQNSTTYRRHIFSLRVYKQEALAALDPDDV